MTPPTPHLLSLPRELRDMIYGYLHHEVTMAWPWDNVPTEDPESDSPRLCDLTIHNAPLLSVLLTHPLLYGEYCQAPSFTAPVVTFCMDGLRHQFPALLDRDLSNRVKAWMMQVLHHQNHMCSQLQGETWVHFAFRHAQRLTILLMDSAVISWLTEWLWTIGQGVIEKIKSHAPDLTVLHVASKIREWPILNQPDLPIQREKLASAARRRADSIGLAMGSAPQSLGGIPRVSWGDGYAVGCTNWFWTLPSNKNDWENGRHQWQEIHVLARIGAYVYSYGTDAKESWNGKDVMLHWPMGVYREDVTTWFEENEAEEMVRWPFEICAWEEMG